MSIQRFLTISIASWLAFCNYTQAHDHGGKDSPIIDQKTLDELEAKWGTDVCKIRSALS
jgi:hypothetical protein